MELPRFTRLTDLASSSVGGQILFATDEWFAAADNLLKSDEPAFDPNTFTEYGKEMDGWESRRKRQAGHDWCVLRLGLPGVVHGFLVDTAFFTGNQTPRVSIQGACLDAKPHTQMEGVNFHNDPAALRGLRSNAGIGTCADAARMSQAEQAKTETWEEILPFTVLQPGYEESRYHYIEIPAARQKKLTHLRVNYFPDGGVARLRVFGIPKVDLAQLPPKLDLGAAEFGGLALSCSNAHYGNPANLIAPGRARNMGEGWETARNPNRPAVFKLDKNGHMEAPGEDWAVLKLATRGVVEEIEVDTNHFKGNFPESCKIDFCDAQGARDTDFDDSGNSLPWKPLLVRTRLVANKRQYFQVNKVGPATHVRVTIYPDGGISRLRFVGQPAVGSSKL